MRLTIGVTLLNSKVFAERSSDVCEFLLKECVIIYLGGGLFLRDENKIPKFFTLSVRARVLRTIVTKTLLLDCLVKNKNLSFYAVFFYFYNSRIFFMDRL